MRYGFSMELRILMQFAVFLDGNPRQNAPLFRSLLHSGFDTACYQPPDFLRVLPNPSVFIEENVNLFSAAKKKAPEGLDFLDREGKGRSQQTIEG